LTLASFGLTPENLTVLILLYSLLFLIVFAIGMFLFYINGFGVYKMSRNLKIKRSWYGFIPFLNVFAFGRIADAVSSKKTNNRSLLITVYILKTLFYVSFIVLLVVYSVELIFAADEAVFNGKKLDPDIFYIFTPAFYLFCVAVIFDTIYRIINAVCAAKIYKLFGSKAFVFKSVIGIFIPIIIPFFVYSVCKNDPNSQQKAFRYDDAVFSIDG